MDAPSPVGAKEALYEYDAFISYRRRDASLLAHWIRDRLQGSKLPPAILRQLTSEKRALYERRPRIWLDRAFEKPSDDFLTRKIYPALDRSARLIIVSTPSVFETLPRKDGGEDPNWVVREIDRFLGEERAESLQRPVDVVLGPGGATDRFPGRLAEKGRWDWIDCRQFSRWGSMGLSEDLDAAYTKLIAGLYDVPESWLPELRQEERRRRNRWLVGISVVTTTVAIVIGVLALVAFQQQRKAIRNAAIADARRLTAEAELIISREPARSGVGALLAADAVSRFRNLNLDSPDASETVTRGLAPLLRIERRQKFQSPAHTVSRHRAVFGGGGRYFAVSDGSPTVQILDPKAGSTRIVALDGQVSHLEFSADGRYLLTATGLNDTANPTVWDLSREQPGKIFEQHLTFRAAAVAPGGRQFMLSSSAGAAVWNTATGSPVCFLRDPASILQAVFSPDAKYLAISYGSQQGRKAVFSLSLFTPDTCGKLRTMTTSRPKEILAFSPDSRYIAAASGSGPEVSVWVASTGKLLSSVSHTGGNGIDNIAFSPAGTFLASAGYDSIARIWNSDSGAEVARLSVSGLPYQVSFSPDEKYVLTVCAGDNVARVWRRDTGAEVARLPHGEPILKAVFLSDGSGLVTASSDGSLRTWTMPGEGVQEREIGADLQAVSSSAGGRFLATLESTGSSDLPPLLSVWDFVARKEIFRVELPSGAHGQIGVSSTKTHAAALSRDGKRVAAIGYWGAGHSVYVWEIGSRTPIFQADRSAEIDSLALSPDGLYLATITKGEGTLWDLTQRRSSPLAHSPVRGVDFSGDSKHIAVIEETATAESCLKEQPLPTGHQLHVLKLARGTDEIAIGNQGTSIAVAARRSIRIWDAAACRLISTIEEKERISAIAFDDTGSLLAASTAQGSAQIWRAPDGDRVYRVHHEGYLANVAFSNIQNGHYLLTSNGYVTRLQGEHAPNPGNIARLWPWRQEDILAGACRVLGNYTSREFPQDPDFDASVRRVCGAEH
jgi:WD40 repeat protein